MHVKRYWALSLGLSVFAVMASRIATASTNESVEIRQTFTCQAPNARSVGVAGEFTDWGIVPMTRGNDGVWSLTVKLKPGYYGYKLVVDGDWVFDPTTSARKTVNDIEDSAIGGAMSPPTSETTPAPVVSEKTVPTLFLYSDASAKTVHLAGDFNGWLDNVDGKVTGHSEWLLQNVGAGNWVLTVPLAIGKHSFKYVIDGGARWETNLRLPVDGDGNSIVDVRAAVPATVSPSSAGALFTYMDPAAKSVSVAGEFNQWNATVNPMKKGEQDIWSATIPLKPGKYLYKFMVDGAWKTDPLSLDGPDDGYGGKNSVKIVAP